MSEIGFWTLIGVIIGATLGFGGTYLLQRLAENRRKGKLRTVARNIIGIEIIHNLNIIEQIEHATIKTINDDKGLLYTSNMPPRNKIFDKLLDLTSLSVLDNTEQGLLIEVFSQLNLVTREFAAWPDKIRQVSPYSQEAKEAANNNLLTGIGFLSQNLVQLLCEVCSREKDGLQDKQLKDIYEKIKGFKPSGHLHAGKSSDYKKGKEKGEEQYKYLIVWEHDWLECPLEVIELKSIIKEANE